MVVERVRVLTFTEYVESEFRSSGGGTLRVRASPVSVTLVGAGIPEHSYEVYLDSASGRRSVGQTVARGSQFMLSIPSAGWPDSQAVREIRLLYYDSATAFPPPEPQAGP
jgi:hypothetical protein